MDILEFIAVYLFGGVGIMAIIWYANKTATTPMTLKEGMTASFGWFFSIMFFVDSITRRAKQEVAALPDKKPVEPLNVRLEKLFEGKE